MSIGFRLGFPTVADAIKGTLLVEPVELAAFETPTIDFFAAGATYVCVPPVPARFAGVLGAFFRIITKAGTISTAPSIQLGTNSTVDDYAASQNPGGFITQAINTRVTLASVVNPQGILDMSAHGFRVKVNAPATGTGGPALTGRFYMLPLVVPV